MIYSLGYSKLAAWFRRSRLVIEKG